MNTTTHPSEAYILGTLLNFGEGLDYCDKIDSRHFADQQHMHVWATIRTLADDGKPYTADCVHMTMHNDGTFDEAGGIATIDALMERGVSPATLHVHAADLANRRLVRQVAVLAAKIGKEAGEDTDAGSLIEMADREFTALQMQRETRNEITSKLMVINAMKTLERRSESGGIVGHSTGFQELDTITSGLQDGALIILAARPAQGKTCLALNIAANVAVGAGVPVAVFSLEMGADELGARMLASKSRVALQNPKKLSQSDWARLARASGDITQAPVTTIDASVLTAQELRSHARKLHSQGKMRVLIVDYLQLMTGTAESREREIGEISRSLKMLAKELRVPVLALSQLNRGVESRQDKRPTLADLRDSGSIEQDADTVWFIYRDELYNKESEFKGRAEVIVSKNRNGPIGTAHLRFSAEIQRFDNLDWGRP